VSSSLSTGGAGTFFERDVGAFWLAQLLLKWVPPILIDTVVTEVSFQTEHLGWKTDDLLITCRGAGSKHAQLAGQVKRTFTLSETNEECRNAILDFWQDFNNPAVFFPLCDRLVLIVQRGTDTLLGHFARLLDCARASRSGDDFAHRLATPGFISKKAVHYAHEIEKIVSAHKGRTVDSPQIWPFLKSLHLLSLDLDTATRQMEAHVRSALAHTSVDRNGAGVAAASWGTLQRLAESSMKEARTFQYADLPEELRRAHNTFGGNEERLLRALTEHTGPVLQKIRSTIGSRLHLPRAALVQQVLNELEHAQIVIITGSAGSGKSAIGKEVFAHLSTNHFAFAFRVEEFAHAHIDATLQAAQIPGNSQLLQATLSTQERKIVLIESMERLLEKSTRDAFQDLLAQVRDDKGLRVLITCRDYSTEQVRESLLREAGLTCAVVSVPPLEESELDEVCAAVPALSIPLGNARLRSILRNPYFLDKALAIPWSTDRPMPESEREFRQYFWQQVVRLNRSGQPGSGRQREQVLQQIAIRRARALSEYIPTTDLDPAIIEALKADSLINSPEGRPALVATAHDVLEDWSILEWFEEQHLADASSFASLAATIGTHPAVRRSYRKWVTELLEREPAAADRLFANAMADVVEGAQFRDDTLVSILKAPLAPALLARHGAALIARNCAPLKRIIHLLRVACVLTPDWLGELREYGSTFNVPDGLAWPAVLKLVRNNLKHFGSAAQTLLLGLIEDAVRGVTWREPEVFGEDSVASIAYVLLENLRGWRSDDARKRVLTVIAKIPKADPNRFEAVLRGAGAAEERDRVSEEFQEMLLTTADGMPAVRDLPALMMDVATGYLLASEEEIRSEHYRHYSTDIDMYFGIRDGHRRDFYPASAIRGPWVQLLRSHPVPALNFYFRIFNHSIDWYVHPRVPDSLEQAEEIELTFADGTVRRQWGNRRHWTLYRGLMPSPYALQSLLMALEKWLLEYAHVYPTQLDAILLQILRNSESSALSAVVASIATAHWRHAGEALLVLLSAPVYLHWDTERKAQEPQIARLINFFPQLQADKKIHEQDRKQSNSLPHRQHDLESAIANLQLGPLAPRVHEILDRHVAALPAPNARSRADHLRLLALGRMDLRQYTVGEEPVTLERGEAGRATESDEQAAAATYVQLKRKPLDPDVQAVVDEGASAAQAMNDSLGPWMWAMRCFNGEADAAQKGQWHAWLTVARAADRDHDDGIGTRNGPGWVAAVCVRDHWAQLTLEEQAWCIEVVCSEIFRTADLWTDTARIQQNNMAADRACASVVARLLTKLAEEKEKNQVRRALAAALTHPNQEVSWHAAGGINAEVWGADRELALRCINAIALQASGIEARWEELDRRPMCQPKDVEALFAAVAGEVRHLLAETDELPDDAYITLDLESRAGVEANPRILMIFAFAPSEPQSVASFERASGALVDQWDEKEKKRAQSSQRNFESEQATKNCMQRFLMRVRPQDAERVLRPILDATDRHPDEVDDIVRGLTYLQDRDPHTSQYWFLWGLFAEAVKRACWLAWLDQDRPTGDGMLAAIFLTYGWKENVRHWTSLEGHAQEVDALFESLPRVAIVLESYLAFLYHVGAKSLPHAFIGISTALQQGNVVEMLRNSNSVFMLEVLLQRHVYGRPLELKQSRAVRDAVLYLLDALVERGSSAAFRMRDDFVTPAG
jgi:hypothetical protein